MVGLHGGRSQSHFFRRLEFVRGIKNALVLLANGYIQAATKVAIEVPLGILERSVDAIAAAEVAATGNKNARSDAGVAGLTARACAEGAYYNVLINLDGFKDETYAQAATARADAAFEQVSRRADALASAIRADLS